MESQKIDLKKLDLKTPLIMYAGFSFFVVISFLVLFTDGAFPVQYSPAIPGNSNYPEQYIVHISPAYAFSLTWGFLRIVGILLWIAIGAFLIAIHNDIINNKTVVKYAIPIFAIAMLLSLLAMFASTKYTNNSKVVDAVTFEKIKNDKDALKGLFKKEDLLN